MNTLVRGLFQPLLRHQLLFIELLPGTKTAVFYLDIDIRFKAGKANQVSGQCIDFNRASHVKDKDFSAFCKGSGFQYKSYSFRNGHKITDNIGMGYGYRTSLFDLLFENRNNGAVGAQYISEAYRHKFCLNILEYCSRAVFIRILHALMGEELGDVLSPPRLNLTIEGLNNHFTKPLACSHDIRRIHRFIRGNQYEALATVYHCGISRFIGT